MFWLLCHLLTATLFHFSALTEKIVVVLPRMKCPHRLDPHQIQGLDFIHIFPVIQWLVKRAIETREEFGDYIRSYSVSQYSKFHTTPDELEFESRKDKAVGTMTELKVCVCVCVCACVRACVRACAL